MTQNLGVLRNWTLAAGQVSTLAGYNAFLDSARTLAVSVNGHLPVNLVDRSIRDHNAFQLLITGLNDSPEALVKAAAALPEDVVERLAADVTRHSSYPPPALGGGAVSKAARESRTMAGYVFGRTGAILNVVRDGKYSDPVIDHYRFDAEKMKGRFQAHRAPERLLTSEEGRETYEKTHRDDLEKVSRHVETQLGIGPAEVRSRFEAIYAEVLPYAEKTQKLWDDLAIKFRDGNPPDFGKVSEAFWNRDQAIRGHAGLKSRKIGPWEFELLQMPRDQRDFYLSSWAYVQEKLSQEEDQIKSSLVLTDRGSRLASLRQFRLDAERAYMNLARGQGTEDDRLTVAGAEGRYLSFLATGLEGLSLDDLRPLIDAAERAKQRYIQEDKRMNVSLAVEEHNLFKGREEATLEIDRREFQWQPMRYNLMIDLLIQAGNVSKTKIGKLRSLVRLYEKTAKDYIKVVGAMMEEDPSQREHNRNGAYRDVFNVLWELHRETKEALQKAKIPGADNFELLSFSYKIQQLFIARGAQGVHGVEPLVEVTLGLKDALDQQEHGAYLLPKLYTLAGRDWGVNILSHYARRVHVTGTEKLFGFFGQGLSPESYLVEGGLEVFRMDAQGIPHDQFPRHGALLDVTHTGQLEFPQAMGISYLFWHKHTAILAQKGVSMFPVAGPFLGGIDVGAYHYLGSGAYIQRSKDPKKRQSENFTLIAHMGMGNFVNEYGGGTRDIANPLPSPYADLRKHKWALLVPTFHATRYSTGHPIKVAQEAGKPIIPAAHTLNRIYPENSMPMPPEIQPPNGKDFGTALKGKFGPLSKKLSDLAHYPGKLTGFVSENTMFPYMRPGEDSADVSYGDPIFPESMIYESNLEAMGFGPQLQEWATLPEKEREQKIKWILLQLNFAPVRYGEMRAGYLADAGINGDRAH
ncbi:MAG TPA: hypothetical protein VFX30_11625 [bacterium]|nr:hypothetical protein [bacterium]